MAGCTLFALYGPVTAKAGKHGKNAADTGAYGVALMLGRAVQVDSIKTRVESAPGVCNQRLKLKCDEPLSNFAFNFNVRRYSWATSASTGSPPPSRTSSSRQGGGRLIVIQPRCLLVMCRCRWIIQPRCLLVMCRCRWIIQPRCLLVPVLCWCMVYMSHSPHPLPCPGLATRSLTLPS
jgi:hypothetical protein